MFKKKLLTTIGTLIASALVFGGAVPVASAVEPIPLNLPASVSSLVNKTNTAHPYVIGTKTDFDRIKATSTTNTDVANMKTALLKRADLLLTKPVQPYVIPDGLRLLDASREVKERSYTLGAAWQITKDTKYAERLWKELDNASNYKDWNPKHFLDTAEMTGGVGIGYDWIYDYLTTAQRTKIRNAIIVKGLQEADKIYANPTGTWAASNSNWNNVSNGGITIGALAIAKEAPTDADKTLSKSINSATYGIQEWAPDGGYTEGIGYWAYAMQYTTNLLSALKSSTGTDFGLAATPGLSQAAYYPLYMRGPNPSKTAFNYGDEYPSLSYLPENLYLGKLYNNPLFTQFGMQPVKGSTSDARALIWFDPAMPVQTPTQANLPLDKYFRKSETVSFNSAWDQPLSTYSAFKGRGEVNGHMDLDLGSFVMSSLDETWAVDLGRDDYTYVGNMSADRWTFYRKRAEGHNTIVFNPSTPVKGTSNADQNEKALAPINSFSSGISTSYAISDLTQADPNLVSWKRGIKQFDNKEQVLIQDEVLGKTSLTNVWWFMHTSANIEVSSDGKSAVLSKPNGKKVLARLISSDTSLTFSSAEAAALPASPSTAPQQDNTGVRKLAVNISGKKDFTLAVQLTPIRVSSITPATETIKALSTWTPASTVANSAQLKTLNVNGKPLTGFTPQTVSYDVIASAGTVPVVTATGATSQDVVKITQAATQPGKAIVTVTSPNKAATTYNLWFENTDTPVKTVTASTVASATEGPDKTVDSDKTTKWTGWGDQWIQYDLGSVQAVKNMGVSWGGNAARSMKYEIQYSSDGVTWNTVKDALYTLVNTTDEIVLNTSARYVRINVHGDTVLKKDLYSSIYEVRFYAAPTVSTAYNNYISSVKPGVNSKDIKINETFKNTLTGYRVDGKTIALTNSTTTYTSSNPAIATVDSTGLVKGLTEGSVKIMVKTVATAGRTVSYSSYIVNVDDPNLFTLNPTADIWVNGGDNATKVLGPKDKVLFNKDSTVGTTDRKAFIQFQLPDLTGMEVVSAQLKFNAYINDGNGTATDTFVNPAKGLISETTTTYNNRPGLNASIGKVYVSGADAQRTVDITAYMKTQSGGASKAAAFGFSQVTKYGMNTYISSRESDNPPVLVLVVKKKV